MKINLLALSALQVAVVAAQPGAPANVTSPSPWPAATAQSRPWVRWWWMGSAVDAPNLRRELTQFKQAGMGGV
jgi:hypothetical protein